MIDFASVRAGVDLVELVASRLGDGTRVGREVRFLCPFHGERTPSFYVSAEKGSFFCFGCGAKGDALDFVRHVDGVPLEEALVRLNAAPAPRPTPRRLAPAPPPPPKDAAALWLRLAWRDELAESYLEGRGLRRLEETVLRFNVGGSGDSWLDWKAEQGYRAAFAVRRPDGVVQTISLRHVGPDEPPDEKKTLVLPGCSTKGAAIVSPEIADLAGGDPEFARDRVLILEGGTDFLGASAIFAGANADRGGPPTWAIAAVGARQAAGVAEAFAPMLRGRTVLIGLDADHAGRTAALEVARAAEKAGAKSVLLLEPILGAKDWAEAAQKTRRTAAEV